MGPSGSSSSVPGNDRDAACEILMLHGEQEQAIKTLPMEFRYLPLALPVLGVVRLVRSMSLDDTEKNVLI